MTPPLAAPRRIAIGTFEIAGFVETLGDAFTRLGHEVTTAVRFGDRHLADAEYDLDIGADVEAVPWGALEARLLDPRAAASDELPADAAPLDRLHWLVARHDLFVFVYGSLYPDRFCRPARMGLGREFPLLKRLGKQIVCVFVGPEIRHASAFDQELVLHQSRAMPLASAVPQWGRVAVGRPLLNLRRAERWADLILSQPNQSGLALRPYGHLFAPLDLARFAPAIPGRERPIVVHAPSQRAIKGTQAIVAALEALRARGVDHELRLVEGVQNREVLAELANADVVVDQLHFPVHGRLGAEALASGCALACGNDQRFEPFPAGRPVWHVDASCVEARLEPLLRRRPLRLRLAEEGLAYVRRWHDHLAVAGRILEGLTAPASSLEHRPEFFARHYELPPRASLARSLLAANAEIIARHGLPSGVRRRGLVARGLLEARPSEVHGLAAAAV